jgi:head-tail adaptor
LAFRSAGLLESFWGIWTHGRDHVLVGKSNSTPSNRANGVFKLNYHIQGDIAAAQKSNKENTAEVVDDAAPQTAAATSTWIDLRSHWARIREKLMEIAFDKNVDGRTRAAYSRIDLRSGYVPFVSKLKGDNMLGKHVEQFEKAANLWEKHRRNRSAVDEMVVKEMKDYADALG